jgi:hypothetical protein
MSGGFFAWVFNHPWVGKLNALASVEEDGGVGTARFGGDRQQCGYTFYSKLVVEQQLLFLNHHGIYR